MRFAKTDRDAVIVSAVRTPIGKFGGSLKGLRAHRLAAVVMDEALRRAGLAGADLDEVIAGECIQCPDEANTARTAALAAGIPVEVPAFTVQKQCSSSMQALGSARLLVTAGEAGAVLVVGVESMSNAPYVLKTARWGQRLTHGEMTDSLWELLNSGSRILGSEMIMGLTAENLAERHGISRADQDEVALRSHRNAEAAIRAGRFGDEIVPVRVPGRKGETVVDTDEHPRFGLTLEDLAKLPPAFKEGGTVTAGNSSGLNDGAAAAVITSRARARALGLPILGRVVAQTSAGVPPEIMGYGPVPATRRLLERTGIGLGDIGLVELNEAFAAQYLACERDLGLDRERVNVNGSGIGLGHPVGATGLRLVVSLLHEMRRRGVELGLATLCVGGGMGMATLMEAEG
ncbi:MAG: thiolase family protein [Deltaproteobacteria bacterium]|nr:thiolase family protein [Deltaproteobacteria bacterium]